MRSGQTIGEGLNQAGASASEVAEDFLHCSRYWVRYALHYAISASISISSISISISTATYWREMGRQGKSEGHDGGIELDFFYF